MNAEPSKIVEVLTSSVKRGSDVLFVENPKGTSVGAFFGIALYNILQVFAPGLRQLTAAVDLERLSVYGTIAVGVILFNIPTLFRRRQLPREIEEELELIRRMHGKVPAWQIKARYLDLCERVAAVSVPRRPTSRRVVR